MSKTVFVFAIISHESSYLYSNFQPYRTVLPIKKFYEDLPDQVFDNIIQVNNMHNLH